MIVYVYLHVKHGICILNMRRKAHIISPNYHCVKERPRATCPRKDSTGVSLSDWWVEHEQNGNTATMIYNVENNHIYIYIDLWCIWLVSPHCSRNNCKDLFSAMGTKSTFLDLLPMRLQSSLLLKRCRLPESFRIRQCCRNDGKSPVPPIEQYIALAIDRPFPTFSTALHTFDELGICSFWGHFLGVVFNVTGIGFQ